MCDWNKSANDLIHFWNLKFYFFILICLFVVVFSLSVCLYTNILRQFTFSIYLKILSFNNNSFFKFKFAVIIISEWFSLHFRLSLNDDYVRLFSAFSLPFFPFHSYTDGNVSFKCDTCRILRVANYFPIVVQMNKKNVRSFRHKSI